MNLFRGIVNQAMKEWENSNKERWDTERSIFEKQIIDSEHRFEEQNLDGKRKYIDSIKVIQDLREKKFRELESSLKRGR